MLTNIPRGDSCGSTGPARLRVAMLTSHRAPGLSDVLARATRGGPFAVVGVVSSEETFADRVLVERHQLPCVMHPVRAFHRARKRPLSDMLVREAYDRELAWVLHDWRADLVLCCSYLYLLTAPVLAAWPNRVISLHHSDMLDRLPNGQVRYPGLRAVRDAVLGGAAETRSSLHIVTPDLDSGPVILRSWAFPLPTLVGDGRRWGAVDLLKAYAFAHQEWMLRRAWGPMMVHGLELAAHDRTGLADGCLLGAPWDLTEDRRLVSRAVPAGRSRWGAWPPSATHALAGAWT